jgi:hypothetical protein
MSDISDNTPENTPEGATKYLLNWMKKCKEEFRNNPEAFQLKERGFYIGGMKLMPGDTVVNDKKNGLPYINRKGCCQ